MRVLVVDDEPVARDRLRRMLERIDGVACAGEAANTREALESVARLAPDVLLMDIQMPGQDGMSFVRQNPGLPPVIFTTAYDQYAVDAFEACAVDYLLKPVRQARLEAALAKMRTRGGADAASLERLLAQLVGTARIPERVTVRDGETLRVFEASAVARFYASDKYTCFHHQGREHLLEESLNALEERLAPCGFLRVHRGELVNLGHVRALRPGITGSVVELSTGESARVSRRHLAALRRALNAE